MPDKEGSYQPEFDPIRRELLTDAAKMTGAGIALDFLSKIQPIQTATVLIGHLRDRGQRLDQTTSQSSDIQPLSNTHNEETGSNQTTPSPEKDINQSTIVTNKLKQDLVAEIEGLSPEDVIQWIKDNEKLLAAGGTAITAAGGILRIWRTLHNRKVSRERADDQRFQGILAGLGSSEIDAKAAAASGLLTFLREPRHDRYYQQIFGIAVNHFRNRTANEPGHPKVTALDQAFVTLFTESAQRVREKLKKDRVNSREYGNYLDASNVHLEGIKFVSTDLSYINFTDANLSGANFTLALLNSVTLFDANLSNANLNFANLKNAQLFRAILTNANLMKADLTNADLYYANLSDSDLRVTRLKNANFKDANLSGVKFFAADLTNANLSGTNLIGATPEEAMTLKGVHMAAIKGYDDPIKRHMCEDKGADFFDLPRL